MKLSELMKTAMKYLMNINKCHEMNYEILEQSGYELSHAMKTAVKDIMKAYKCYERSYENF